ncbi:MAG: 3-isopropylmalate dehydratase small subunit [Myxococcota bacterium]
MPLLVIDIDTAQISPARFLKVPVKTGLWRKLFSDWRYLESSEDNSDFILNDAELKDAQVLLAGDNFGCGSSREHAPWALTDWGFRAIISTSFADIFRNNALKNGLLPIEVDGETHADIIEALQHNRQAKVSVSLEADTLTLPTGRVVKFEVESFARKCLLEGKDQLGYLLAHDSAIGAYEAARGW